MKIRTRFVSNSSSASFVVILDNTTKEDLIVLFEKYNILLWMLIKIQVYFNDLTETIKEQAKINIKIQDKEELSWYEALCNNNYQVDEILKEQEDISKIYNEDLKAGDILDLYLKLKNIELGILGSVLVFEDQVSMFNDIETDLPEFLLLIKNIFSQENREKDYYLKIINK